MIDTSRHDLEGRYPHHTNIQKYFDFLRNQIKNPDDIDLESLRDEWVKDLEMQNADSGHDTYVLRSYSAADRHETDYRYETEWVPDPEDPESGSGTMYFHH